MHHLRQIRIFLILVLICFKAVETDANQLPIITPDWEPKVLALFAPYKIGDRLPSGWELTSVRLTAHSVELECSRRDQHAVIRFSHPSQADALTDSFVLSIDTRQTPTHAERALLEEIANLVRQNDTGNFWEGGSYLAVGDFWNDTIGSGVASLRFWQLIAFELSLLTIFISIIIYFYFSIKSKLCLKEHLVTLKALSTETQIAMAIIALGTILRFTVPAPNLYLPGGIGINRIFLGQSGSHTVSYLFRHLNWLFPPTMDGFFLFNQVVGSATLVAWYVLSRTLIQSPAARLGSLFIFALLPVHIRFSASDVMVVGSCGLSLLTWLAYLRYARMPSLPAHLIGCCILALAAQARFENLLLIPIVYGYILATLLNNNKHLLRRKDFYLCTVILFLLLIPRLLAGGGQLAVGMKRLTADLNILPQLINMAQVIFLNNEVLSYPLLILLFAGMISLSRKEILFVSIILAFFFVTQVYHFRGTSELLYKDSIRYFLNFWPIYLFVMAKGLEKMFKNKWNAYRLTGCLLVFSMLPILILCWQAISTPQASVKEYRFLVETLKTLPTGSLLVCGDDLASVEVRYADLLSQAFREAHPGAEPKLIAPAYIMRIIETNKNVYYYQGLHCFERACYQTRQTSPYDPCYYMDQYKDKEVANRTINYTNYLSKQYFHCIGKSCKLALWKVEN